MDEAYRWRESGRGVGGLSGDRGRKRAGLAAVGKAKERRPI